MKFKLLLWIIGRLMRRASSRSREFRKLAASSDVVYQIMTMDGKKVRHYALAGGRISTAASPHPAPDCTIMFRDATYGFSVLTSKDKSAFPNGMRKKDIVVRGSLPLLVRFQKLTAMMRAKKITVPEDLRTVGFVGVGFIGAPMARSLMRGGFTVKAHDINPVSLEKIASDGAIPCPALADLADAKAFLIMVNTMAQVNDVVDRLCRALPADASIPILVMSTVSPDDIIELRKKLDAAGRAAIRIIDAPVSGAPILAEAGKLSIMAGGDSDVFDRIRPVLEAMGDPEKIFHLGPLGSGSAMKLVNNIIGLSQGLIVCEALNLGALKGMDPDVMTDVINESTGKSFLTEQWPLTKMMFEFMLDDTAYNAKDALFTTGVKDLETACRWAEKSGEKLRSAESAIGQINSLHLDEMVSILKRLTKRV